MRFVELAYRVAFPVVMGALSVLIAFLIAAAALWLRGAA